MYQLCILTLIPLLVGAYDNGAPLSRLPPLGWSSWVALGPETEKPIFDYCDEKTVKESADAMHTSGLYDAGYRHLHLDDCWAGGRYENGSVYPEEDHFPNGMKVVIDYVHSKNLTFGLYTCGGTLTCVGKRPGSKDHWDDDAQSYASWGVDWVKMDWCNTPGQDPVSTYPLMSKALNKTGRPIHFNMCEWGLENPASWGNEVAQSWRIATDHSNKWSSTASTIATVAVIPKQYRGRPYGWNDMDMLETGNVGQSANGNGVKPNMTELEYLTEFSMWAIAASPLLVTTPIAQGLTDMQKKILLNTEILAINQDVTPSGMPVDDPNVHSIWLRDLSDGSKAVAFYNQYWTSLSVGVEFTDIGWSSSQTVMVRDLWKHETLPNHTGRFPSTNLTLYPHETQVFRFYPISP